MEKKLDKARDSLSSKDKLMVRPNLFKKCVKKITYSKISKNALSLMQSTVEFELREMMINGNFTKNVITTPRRETFDTRDLFAPILCDPHLHMSFTDWIKKQQEESFDRHRTHKMKQIRSADEKMKRGKVTTRNATIKKEKLERLNDEEEALTKHKRSNR